MKNKFNIPMLDRMVEWSNGRICSCHWTLSSDQLNKCLKTIFVTVCSKSCLWLIDYFEAILISCCDSNY